MHDVTRFIKPTYLVLLMAIIFGPSAIADSKPSEIFEFALIGDLPYGTKPGEKDPDYDLLVQQLNSDDQLSWVIHVGDIKTGGSPCTDEMLEDRKARFDRIKRPFVLTPGDNEWTDCHRPTTGNFDPLERLEKLRALFFRDQTAAATRDQLGVTTQSTLHKAHSEFIENYTWTYNNIRFATAHVVGSLNGKAKFSTLSQKKRSDAHDDEVKRREAATQDWLAYTFDLATQNNEAAIFLIIHANPGLEHGKVDKATKKAFAPLVKQLQKLTETFGKPVVLAHGDSHYFRIDKPSLAKKRPPAGFTRLESFGNNNKSWIKVIADPNSANVFRYEIFSN